MEAQPPPWTLGQIAGMLRGELRGPENLEIRRPVPAGMNEPAGITFAESADYLAKAEQSSVGAILLPRDANGCAKPCILVDDPRASFAHLLALCVRALPLNRGKHPSAVVDPAARVHESAQIGPFVVIERRAEIGPRTRIYPFCYVGENCLIGEECVLYPHVVLVQDVTVGDRSILHSGTVLGADGFGYYWDGKRRTKIPQVGGVNVGSDVEIGANSTVDRATAGETRIGDRTKLDNLVQIAHNVTLGDDVAIASLSGVAGSAQLGDRVVMAGGVGVGDHARIGDDVILGGRSVATSDILKAGEYLGFPARPIAEARRALILATKLPELASRIRELERELLDKKEDVET